MSIIFKKGLADIEEWQALICENIQLSLRNFA